MPHLLCFHLRETSFLDEGYQIAQAAPPATIVLTRLLAQITVQGRIVGEPE